MSPTTQRTTRKTPTQPPCAKKTRKTRKKKERLNLFNSKIQFLPGYQGDLDQHWWLLDSYRSPHRMHSCATCWIQLGAVLPSLPTMRIGFGTVVESLGVVYTKWCFSYPSRPLNLLGPETNSFYLKIEGCRWWSFLGLGGPAKCYVYLLGECKRLGKGHSRDEKETCFFFHINWSRCLSISWYFAVPLKHHYESWKSYFLNLKNTSLFGGI